MADKSQEALFSAELQDGISGPADTAARALENLKSRMDADTKALAQMNKAMKNIQAGSVVNVATFKRLRAAIDAKKVAIAQAQAAYVSAGGSFTAGAKQQQSALSKLAKQASSLGGPIALVAGGFKYLQAAVRAHPLLAAAAAIALIGVAAIRTAKSLYVYATAQANAYRMEKLRLEGLSKIRTYHSMYMGLAETSANDLGAAVDRVSSKVGIGRDKLLEYTNQLYTAGLRGKNLDSALEGMAMKFSAQGEEQAQLFKGWATYYALSGRNVDALTQRVRGRLGPIVKAQLLDANVQAEKLQESYSMLFRDLKMDKLLKAKKEVNDLFSQTTATGRAMKLLLTNIVQPFVDLQTKVQPYIKRFFQGLVYGALKVDIAFIQLKKAWVKVFGPETASTFDATKIVFWGVAAAVIAIGGAAWTLAAAFDAVGYAAKFAYGEVLAYIDAFKKLGGWIGEKSKAIGTKMWQGMTEGIAGGQSPVEAQVAELARAAQQELADKLVIRSPSRVFEKLGRSVPEGFALGVTRGQDETKTAVDGMVSVPKPASSATEGGGAGQLSRASVTVGSVHVHLERSAQSSGGDSEVKAIGAAVKQELERILQGVAIEMGAPA